MASAGPGSLLEQVFVGKGVRVRVLGVDPGLTRCGLGVVDSSGGRQVQCVSYAVVRTPPDLDVSRRLLRVADAVRAAILEHRPEVVAVERVFSQTNVRTVMGTAQASGVVALVAAQAGLRVMFHTPSEVKAAVTGSGRAGKEQVTTMVTRLLKLTQKPTPADAADALALAICHCWRGPMLDRMAEARAASDRLARAHRARLAEARSTEPRPVAARPAAARPADRSAQDRPAGPRSANGRPAGLRSAQDRPEGPRSANDRPAGPRSANDRSANDWSTKDRLHNARLDDPRSAEVATKGT